MTLIDLLANLMYLAAQDVPSNTTFGVIVGAYWALIIEFDDLPTNMTVDQLIQKMIGLIESHKLLGQATSFGKTIEMISKIDSQAVDEALIYLTGLSSDK